MDSRTRKIGFRPKTLCLLALIAAVLDTPSLSRAESLFATVRNDAGEAMRSAVVYAVRAEGTGDVSPAAEPVQIDQINKEFVPYVTALPVGTKVSFPNHDQIRHHVYSFSEAKTFEIPLYKGIPAKLVVFDKPGVVVLGCNIHDWMKGYVFVSETPYFAVTDRAGDARIELPPGDYRIEVWHPEISQVPAVTALHHPPSPGEDARLAFSVEHKRVWKPRRAPAGRDFGYR